MSGALLSFESLQPQRTRPGDWKSPFSHESAGKGCNKALWTTIKKQPLVPFVCNESLKRKLDSVKLVVCLCSTSLSLLHI